MTTDAFIPVGRTSLAKQGAVPLQVQTEYAARPYPRITTTVLNGGQVLHKIERKLEQAVASMEERSRAEALIHKQHGEVVRLIEEEVLQSSALELQPAPPGFNELPVYDRLASVPGFQHFFRLNLEGVFAGNTAVQQFKKTFRRVYKDLPQIIELFPYAPGGMGMRSTGVYEVIRNSLYFVSTGPECYFVSVKPESTDVDYETILKEVLIGPS